MNFTINLSDKSIDDVMKLIGYEPPHFLKEGEVSMVRSLGRNEYPKFHLYGERRNGTIIFRLHLDQKETLHEGLMDVMGLHDGKLVEAEARRIQKLLK